MSRPPLSALLTSFFLAACGGDHAASPTGSSADGGGDAGVVVPKLDFSAFDAVAAK